MVGQPQRAIVQFLDVSERRYEPLGSLSEPEHSDA